MNKAGSRGKGQEIDLLGRLRPCSTYELFPKPKAGRMNATATVSILEATKPFETRCEVVDSASHVLAGRCKPLAIQDARVPIEFEARLKELSHPKEPLVLPIPRWGSVNKKLTCPPSADPSDFQHTLYRLPIGRIRGARSYPGQVSSYSTQANL